jgi:hypothetical protein
MVAAESNGDIWTSIDYGKNWTDSGQGPAKWCSIAVNSDGGKIIAGYAGDGSIQGSAGVVVFNSGWMVPTLSSSSGLTGAVSVTISGDGANMVVADNSANQMWQSTNGGSTFSSISSTPGPANDISMARDKSTMGATWASPLAFLYSGQDGMFGSSDGVTWVAAPNSVAAIGMAWIDNIWVAISIDGHSWRSTDGAQTWVAGPDILNVRQVVAMRPPGVDEFGAKKAGVFAAWGNNDAGDGIVYLSSDLGVHFDPTLIILAEDAGAFESIESLSGCGGAFFLTTQWSSDDLHNDNGKVYVCTDGIGFDAGTIVLGPASASGDNPSAGYSAFNVDYDQSTGEYTLFGAGGVTPVVLGQITSKLLYTTSMSTEFDETATGTLNYQTTWTVSAGGHVIQNSNGGAVGNGYGAVIFPMLNAPASLSYTPTSATFSTLYLTGTKADLFTADDGTPEWAVGPVCFKSDTFIPGEVATAPFPGQKTDPSAIFACVAMASNVTTGVAEGGGVYTAVAGHAFEKTHDGSLIQGRIGGLYEPVGAAVAVGVVTFSLTS